MSDDVFLSAPISSFFPLSPAANTFSVEKSSHGKRRHAFFYCLLSILVIDSVPMQATAHLQPITHNVFRMHSRHS